MIRIVLSLYLIVLCSSFKTTELDLNTIANTLNNTITIQPLIETLKKSSNDNKDINEYNSDKKQVISESSIQTVDKDGLNKIESIEEDQRNEIDSCEIFCLQPDIRLCQCAKDELNKYLPNDLAETSKESKNASNSILPHVYMSDKEKETCGEYSLIIRKLNIAINKNPNNDFYFEPAIDFQIESPSNHTISNLFFWGDWLAFYKENPYSDFDNYIPGCVWQIPSGQKSFYSTVTVNQCRNQIVSLLNTEVKKLNLCIWSYERYWSDKQSGPCLCCEVDFNDCNECFKCFKNYSPQNNQNSEGYNDWINHCLKDNGDITNNISDSNLNKEEFNPLSCYKCLNFKNSNYNCQDYNQFLNKVLSNNKYNELTQKQKKLFDLN